MFAGVVFSVLSLTLIWETLSNEGELNYTSRKRTLSMSGQHFNSSCIDCDCCIDGHCNREGDNETCDYGCTDGHWGTHCMYDCPQICSACSNQGRCPYPCMDGVYGSYCNKTCPSNCATCRRSTFCTTCKDGFYIGRYHDLLGTSYFHDCHLECQVNCKKCSSYFSCQEWKTGTYRNSSCVNCSCCIAGGCIIGNDDNTCDYGCTDGHYGAHCMYDCGQNCARCYQTTGICDECVEGLYGPYCNRTCLARCATCRYSTTCTTCKDGLYIGRYKDQPGSQLFNDCQLACPVNCKKCSSFGSCTKCQTGKFGTTCSSLCSRGCLNNVCEQSNGFCVCSEGFEGLRCNKGISGIESEKCVLGQTAAKRDNNIAMYVLVGMTCLFTGLLISFGVVMFIRYQRKRNEGRRSPTGGNNQEMTDIAANGQQMPDSTNLPIAAYYNAGQTSDRFTLDEMTDIAANGQQMPDSTNLPIAAYYNAGQTSDRFTLDGSAAVSAIHYTTLQNSKTDNVQTKPNEQENGTDYENIK